MEQLRLLEKEPRENVREYAYRVLYDNIMNLHLVPGTAMSEQELSTMLSVSRTPVREAFIRLAQKGLLDVLPQRGTFVSKINTEQLAEFRFLRVTMETAVVALACREFPEEYMWKLQQCLKEQELLQQCLKEQELYLRRRDVNGFFASDNQTHSILYQGCGKPHIWQIIESSTADYMRARVLNIAAAAEQMNILYSQHQALAEAILRHDAQRGIAIMEEHINKGIIDVEVLRKQYPDYFK